MRKKGHAENLREVLGRAHYERMRLAMLPDLVIEPWEQLKPATRTAYRRRMDYLVPALVALLTENNTTHPEQEAS